MRVWQSSREEMQEVVECHLGYSKDCQQEEADENESLFAREEANERTWAHLLLS